MPGPNQGFRQDDLEPQDVEMRKALLHNVLLPACQLYPITGVNLFPEVANGICGVPYIAGIFMSSKHPIPSNRPPEWARRQVRQWHPDPPVVLNIRDCGYHDARNSNRLQWETVREVLQSEGYPVVWVDDFGKEFQYQNILLRAALFEYAHAVLGVNNGPMILAKLNANATYALFKPLAPTVATTPEWWAKNLATPPGTPRLPWAYDNQMIIWEEDDAETILKAFHDLPKEKSGKDHMRWPLLQPTQS